MFKILYDRPNGTQEVAEVKQSGGVSSDFTVLWDEREDGELPSITLGGMVRSGDSLTYSQVRMEQSLPKLKADLIQQVNARAQSIRCSPVPFTRVVQDGDDISTAVQFRGPDDFINLSALKNAVDNGATEVTVIMEDNNVYTLTAAEFNTMWAGGLTRNQAAAVNARNLKNSIDAATTIDGLPDITTGWPS